MLFIALVLQSGKASTGLRTGDLEPFGIKSYILESLDLLLHAASETEVDVIFLNTEGFDDGVNQLSALFATGIPIITLTASKSEEVGMRALEAGATDVVPLSISKTLLALKTRRLIALHRSKPVSARSLQIQGLDFDLRNAKVKVAGVPLSLSRRQFDLLLLLAQNFGKFVHRQKIHEALSQRGVENSRSSDMHVSRIRARLREIGAYGFKIDAEYGLGYKLTYQEESATERPASVSSSPSRSVETVGEIELMAEQWTRIWLESVTSGKVTMSQRKASSIEARGGGLDVAKKLAETLGIHLLELTDDRGDLLVAASKHPFRVVC